MDSSLTFTNLNQIDRDAGKYMIGLENERRAALTPPGAPLPFATAAEIKTSYEAVFNAIVQAAHLGHIAAAAENNATARQIREALKNSPTQAQLNAALTGLTT